MGVRDWGKMGKDSDSRKLILKDATVLHRSHSQLRWKYDLGSLISLLDVLQKPALSHSVTLIYVTQARFLWSQITLNTSTHQITYTIYQKNAFWYIYAYIC